MCSKHVFINIHVNVFLCKEFVGGGGIAFLHLLKATNFKKKFINPFLLVRLRPKKEAILMVDSRVFLPQHGNQLFQFHKDISDGGRTLKSFPPS